MTFDDMMAELRSEYVASIPEKVATIRSHFEAGNMDELQNDFHKLKGTGKTYGLPEVSELALEMEMICKSKPEAVPETLPNAIALLERIYKMRSKGQALDLGAQPEFSSIKN